MIPDINYTMILHPRHVCMFFSKVCVPALGSMGKKIPVVNWEHVETSCENRSGDNEGNTKGFEQCFSSAALPSQGHC